MRGYVPSTRRKALARGADPYIVIRKTILEGTVELKTNRVLDLQAELAIAKEELFEAVLELHSTTKAALN